jgi:predicted anti-sigma-YlaC factor YlaD
MRPAVGDRSCIGARRMFSLALDGEASAADVGRAASHIGRCEPCRRFATHVFALTRVLRSCHPARAGAPGELSKGARR